MSVIHVGRAAGRRFALGLLTMKLSHLLILSLGLVLLITNPIRAQFDDEDEMIQDEFEDDVEDEDVVELKVPKEERPVYKAPVAQGNVYFADAFESEADYRSLWVESRAKKDGADDDIAKYDGVWSVEEPEDNPLQGDLTLVLKSKAKHHAVVSKLKKPFEFSGKPFVMQYEVRFQNGQECGGAYVKLLSKDANFVLKKFYDKTPYSIMFGPDKCGNDNKLHFIFRHKNPVNGVYEEKHAKKPSGAIDTFFTDKRTHLYTLVVSPDNSFEIYVDQNLVNSGSLLEDFTPSVNPPKEIVDPDDKKPADWDEREKIPDPDATKPEDWDEDEPEKVKDVDAVMPSGWLEDELELIPDEEAEKPEDWDDDIDGEWEPPMISNPTCEDAPGCGEWTVPMIKNPKYKGKWRAPMIDNPEYKGKWKARMIPNPDFFEDNEPYKMTAIGAVGLELWSMSDNIAFDNFIITDDKSVADKYAADSWELKHSQELIGSSGRSVVDAVMEATNERPWLWAVFVVVVLLPIVLVIAYCCMPGSSSKQDDIIRMKKMDESSPDDPKSSDDKKDDDDDDDDDDDEEEETEEKTEEKAGGDAKEEEKPTASKKKGKGQLEADKADEGDAEDDSDDTPPEDKPQTRSSPRKRRAKRAE